MSLSEKESKHQHLGERVEAALEGKFLVLETFERKDPTSVTKAYEVGGKNTPNLGDEKQQYLKQVREADSRQPAEQMPLLGKSKASRSILVFPLAKERTGRDIQPYSREPLVALAPGLTLCVPHGSFPNTWSGWQGSMSQL